MGALRKATSGVILLARIDHRPRQLLITYRHDRVLPPGRAGSGWSQGHLSCRSDVLPPVTRSHLRAAPPSFVRILRQSLLTSKR